MSDASMLHIRKVARCYHAQAGKFQQAFGIPLMSLWNTLHGFDIVRFDEWVGVPEGRSLHETTLERYGENAAQLIEDLINLKEK